MTEKQDGKQLQRVIKSRQLFMLALGGVIGTGLFLASGNVIHEAGPIGAIISYLIGGFLLYLVMTCLGELSVVMPVSGSFQAHARKFIGPAAGFVIGWIYWMSWVVFVGLEFVSAALLMKRWFPDTPTWIWSAVFIAAILIINLLSAKSFAETEYIFAGLKVLAVLLFIVIGGLAVFGVIQLQDGSSGSFVSHFIGEDGIFPNGFTPVFITMMSVVYAFQGSEIMGVAAGETENPEKNIPKAIKTIIYRIIIFYILAVVVVSALVPFEDASVLESPFVAALDVIGIPYSADIMNFIILIAILSVGNTGLYACSRILWSLSNDGMAPKSFSKLNKRGVPVISLLVTLGFSLMALLSSVITEDTLFIILQSISGIGGAFSWIAIALSQIGFRRQFYKSGGKVEDLSYAVKFYPWVPLLSIAINLVIFVYMAFDPEQRISLYVGFGFVILVYLFYFFRYGLGGINGLKEDVTGEKQSS